MNNLRSITLRVFSQSLLFTVLAFFSFPVSAQTSTQSRLPPLPYPFNSENNGKDFSWLVCDTRDEVQKRILYEYGAVFLSKAFTGQKQSIPCRFNETEINKFVQSAKDNSLAKLPFGEFYLQPLAKKSFQKVIASKGYQFFARNCNQTTSCDLTSKNLKDKLNDDWALRTYEQTEKNWNFPAKVIEEGKKEDHIREWVEKNDYSYDASHPYYDKNDKDSNKNKRPKMYQVAVPGSSQHHFGLAIDVINSQPRLCGKDCVKELTRNGWFRTVRYDAYHFTYLGVVEKNTRLTEKKLRSIGLKKVRCRDYDPVNEIEYWVPAVNGYEGYRNWECKDVK